MARCFMFGCPINGQSTIKRRKYVNNMMIAKKVILVVVTITVLVILVNEWHKKRGTVWSRVFDTLSLLMILFAGYWAISF